MCELVNYSMKLQQVHYIKPSTQSSYKLTTTDSQN